MRRRSISFSFYVSHKRDALCEQRGGLSRMCKYARRGSEARLRVPLTNLATFNRLSVTSGRFVCITYVILPFSPVYQSFLCLLLLLSNIFILIYPTFIHTPDLKNHKTQKKNHFFSSNKHYLSHLKSELFEVLWKSWDFFFSWSEILSNHSINNREFFSALAVKCQCQAVLRTGLYKFHELSGGERQEGRCESAEWALDRWT